MPSANGTVYILYTLIYNNYTIIIFLIALAKTYCMMSMSVQYVLSCLISNFRGKTLRLSPVSMMKRIFVDVLQQLEYIFSISTLFSVHHKCY